MLDRMTFCDITTEELDDLGGDMVGPPGCPLCVGSFSGSQQERHFPIGQFGASGRLWGAGRRAGCCVVGEAAGRPGDPEARHVEGI